MRRFRTYLEANLDRPLHMSEICEAIGVTGGTLRACCGQYLGMGPLRYLWLRRMEQARRALAISDPATVTVTELVTIIGTVFVANTSARFVTTIG